MTIRARRCIRTIGAAFIIVSSIMPAFANSKSPIPPERFCDSLLMQLMRFFPDSIKQCELAVFPFVNTTGDEMLSYGSWVSEYFIYAFRGDPRFSVIDRQAFKKTLVAMDLPLKDILDDSTALEAARRASAPYMMTGTISSNGRDYTIDGRFIDARTGIIITGAQVTASAQEMADLGTQIQKQREIALMTPAEVRSFLVPGLGQMYRKRWVAGAIYMAGFYGTTAGALYEGLGPMKKALDAYNAYKYTSDDEQHNPQLFRQKGDSLYGLYEKKRNIFAPLAVAAGAFWLVNMADITITGAQKKARLRLYYAGDFVEEHGVMVAMEF
jgi:TolB-like protein